jgi:hypothetical protein
MSGLRGYARHNRIKLRARIRFADTGKVVSTNIFLPIHSDHIEAINKIHVKYPKELTVLTVLVPGTWIPLYTVESHMLARAA